MDVLSTKVHVVLASAWAEPGPFLSTLTVKPLFGLTLGRRLPSCIQAIWHPSFRLKFNFREFANSTLRNAKTVRL